MIRTKIDWRENFFVFIKAKNNKQKIDHCIWLVHFYNNDEFLNWERKPCRCSRLIVDDGVRLVQPIIIDFGDDAGSVLRWDSFGMVVPSNGVDDSSWTTTFVDVGGEHVHWLLSLVFVVVGSSFGVKYNREKFVYGVVVFVWWYNRWECWQTFDGGGRWRVIVNRYSGIHSYWWLRGVSCSSTRIVPAIDDDDGGRSVAGIKWCIGAFVIGISWWE